MKQIKGFKNYSITNSGEIYNHKLKRFISQSTHPKGYKMVVLWKNSKEFRFLVHRLVAITYIPNTLKKPQVNHINGIKNDNRIENLEWCTAKENTKHAWQNGLRTSENCLFNYLNSKIVLDLNTGIFYNSMAEVSKLYNIKYHTLVARIKTGKNKFVLI